MCGNLHDIVFSTFKKLVRMSLKSTPSNATKTHKTSALFGLGKGLIEADGTITDS